MRYLKYFNENYKKILKDYSDLDFNTVIEWYDKNRKEISEIIGTDPENLLTKEELIKMSNDLVDQIINQQVGGRSGNRIDGFGKFNIITTNIAHDIYHSIYSAHIKKFKDDANRLITDYTESEFVEEIECLAIEHSFSKFFKMDKLPFDFIQQNVVRLAGFLIATIMRDDFERLLDSFPENYLSDKEFLKYFNSRFKLKVYDKYYSIDSKEIDNPLMNKISAKDVKSPIDNRTPYDLIGLSFLYNKIRTKKDLTTEYAKTLFKGIMAKVILASNDNDISDYRLAARLARSDFGDVTFDDFSVDKLDYDSLKILRDKYILEDFLQIIKPNLNLRLMGYGKEELEIEDYDTRVMTSNTNDNGAYYKIFPIFRENQAEMFEELGLNKILGKSFKKKGDNYVLVNKKFMETNEIINTAFRWYFDDESFEGAVAYFLRFYNKDKDNDGELKLITGDIVSEIVGINYPSDEDFDEHFDNYMENDTETNLQIIESLSGSFSQEFIVQYFRVFFRFNKIISLSSKYKSETDEGIASSENIDIDINNTKAISKNIITDNAKNMYKILYKLLGVTIKAIRGDDAKQKKKAVFGSYEHFKTLNIINNKNIDAGKKLIDSLVEYTNEVPLFMVLINIRARWISITHYEMKHKYLEIIKATLNALNFIKDNRNYTIGTNYSVNNYVYEFYNYLLSATKEHDVSNMIDKVKYIIKNFEKLKKLDNINKDITLDISYDKEQYSSIFTEIVKIIGNDNLTKNNIKDNFISKVVDNMDLGVYSRIDIKRLGYHDDYITIDFLYDIKKRFTLNQ